MKNLCKFILISRSTAHTLVDGFDEVLTLASKVLHGLKRESSSTLNVGAVFVDLDAEFRRTYAKYWLCNDRALALLDTVGLEVCGVVYRMWEFTVHTARRTEGGGEQVLVEDENA